MENKLKDEYRLPNRYRFENYLVKHHDDWYTIKTELNSVGVSFDEKTKKNIAFDPDGGPYITVGYRLPNDNVEVVELSSIDSMLLRLKYIPPKKKTKK